jgi:hypothetical protein
MPDLNGPIDPSFDHPFVHNEHNAIMRKKVDLTHLTADQQNKVYNLIREFWPVFDDRGIFVMVKNYECVIDTGTARPITVKKILYGERETIIMRCCISALAKVGLIRQITDGRWLFKALLAAKPHQEHVRNIDDFIWHFCSMVSLALLHTRSLVTIQWCSKNSAAPFGGGCLTCRWATISLQSRPKVRKNWRSKGLTPSNGHTTSCPLGPPTDLPHSLISSTIPTVFGRSSVNSMASPSTTILTHGSSLTTLSAGPLRSTDL